MLRGAYQRNLLQESVRGEVSVFYGSSIYVNRLLIVSQNVDARSYRIHFTVVPEFYETTQT